MQFTNDQYEALFKLEKWYDKYSHQIIEISTLYGCGIWELIQEFIKEENIDPRTVAYLSYNQKQVLELAHQRYHSYYLDGFVYKYQRNIDFDTIPVLNSKSKHMEYNWTKSIRKHFKDQYSLIIVMDSLMLNEDTLNDLKSYHLPIILIKDPMLIPMPYSYTYFHDANIQLLEPNPLYITNPIVHFAHKVINNQSILPGSYDNVSIVPRKQMNLYNLKSSDMNIALSEEISDQLNNIYRTKISKINSNINALNERVMVAKNMYNHVITNPDEKRVKIYLRFGLVGNITKIYKHAPITKYVPMEFTPEIYHESFTDLIMDRYYLNNINSVSRQEVPDEFIQFKYAYALPVIYARLSYWDKVTVIANEMEVDNSIYKSLLYTAITRARESLTVII